MTESDHQIDVEEIFANLRRSALHNGARANRLYRHGRTLIDLLFPSDDTSDESYFIRAVRTECVIRHAIELINPPDCDALRISLSLDGESMALKKLEQRRQEAAKLYNVYPNTFRLKHEGALLFDLAFQMSAFLRFHPEQTWPPTDETGNLSSRDHPQKGA